jgi:mannose-6-phosphate isomerase-like protein (cupin superfamily)
VRLDIRAIDLRPGSSEAQVPADLQELLYVVVGSGTLHVGGDEYPVEPGSAALLLPGESYRFESDSGLELVSVRAPGGALSRDRVTIRFADCEEQRADEDRTFRVLFETDVTQFVGLVQPSRAPDHSHPFNEVGYILEGRGFAHIGEESTPIGPGSRFHLPPGQVHCIENSGPGVMRILGVFHPAGSPAQRT